MRVMIALAVFAFGFAVSDPVEAMQSDGLIRLQDGKVCSVEKPRNCILFDAKNRVADMSGFVGVIIPESFEAAPGYITEAQFKKIQITIFRRQAQTGTDCLNVVPEPIT